MRKSADFMDRWFTSSPKKKLKPIKLPAQTRSGASSGSSSTAMSSIKTQLNEIQIRVMDIADDITDIKTLLMPKFFNAKGQKGTKDAGSNEAGMYNPLAPSGRQYNKIDDRTGELRGATGKNFKNSAEMRVALETAKLVLKIKQKDDAKVELKKKYAFKEELETYGKEDSVEALRVHLDERLDKIEGMFEKRGGLFEAITSAIGSVLTSITALLTPFLNTIKNIFGEVMKIGRWAMQFGRLIGKGLYGLVRGIFHSVRLLKYLMNPVGMAAMMAGAVVTGLGMFFDMGMKAAANKAIDGLVGDVSKKIAKDQAQFPDHPYSEDQKYMQYKKALELGDKQAAARGPEYVSYQKQRLLTSPNLSEEERKYVTRYYEEKDGNVAGFLDQLAAEDGQYEEYGHGSFPIGESGAPSAPAEGGTGALTTNVPIPAGMSKKQWEVYRNTIGSIESGGDYKAVGGSNDHYDGKYQMGKDAKTDAARVLGIPDPGHTPEAREAFRNNPELQERMFAAYTQANHGYMQNNPKYRSMTKNQQIETLGYAHNQGHGGAKNWLNTGEVGEDGFHTKGTKYSEALAKNLKSVPDEEVLMAQNLSPATTIPGDSFDKEARQHQSGGKGDQGVTVVNAPTVNNVNNNTVGKRPAPKADVLAQDKSLVRTIGQDAQHPVYA